MEEEREGRDEDEEEDRGGRGEERRGEGKGDLSTKHEKSASSNASCCRMGRQGGAETWIGSRYEVAAAETVGATTEEKERRTLVQAARLPAARSSARSERICRRLQQYGVPPNRARGRQWN